MTSATSATTATLHRIEALPGSRRYAVTFRHPNGSEQSATVHVAGSAREIDVAEASLPAGWRRADPAFAMLMDAVRALDAASRFAAPALMLVDLDGGWDVSLGNVVLDTDARPTCTAHGAMTPEAAGPGVWTCEECGARASLGG